MPIPRVGQIRRCKCITTSGEVIYTTYLVVAIDKENDNDMSVIVIKSGIERFRSGQRYDGWNAYYRLSEKVLVDA